MLDTSLLMGSYFFSELRMGSIISAHNQRLLAPHNSSLGFHCRKKNNCPLEEKCLAPKVIYQADVTNDVDNKYKF